MRIEKVAILNEVTTRVKESDYCFIINYGGVDVVIHRFCGDGQIAVDRKGQRTRDRGR